MLACFVDMLTYCRTNAANTNSAILMAGRYTYGEQVANRASTASENSLPRQATTLQPTRARQRPTSIPRSEWNQILMVEQAIQHFEFRFEEFMRSQSRLLEEIRSELEELRTATKKLEAKMKRLEGYADQLDIHGLSERMEIMRLDETAFRRAGDKIAKLEPMLEGMEKFAERLDQHPSPDRETPDSPDHACGRTALQAFFHALDHFGEVFNGYADHETGNEIDRSHQ
ncbi:hypothetical protein AC578_5088 [Pseudocercospora eumusae]|uniref:Uncharacterized protein n=1 Tax=Pseudocercospora eumusae TaxID=321146 RepID=A0A139HIM3_9PEZI|nr:hypothetical protein AC578_5088 [Pseudocercospora eumusae]